MNHVDAGVPIAARGEVGIDAVGVVLADRHRTNKIFTLDQRDFKAIQPVTRGFDAFTILPADL